jgi:farnesol dehydrogenase
MKIFVTGASGFIGVRLCQRLADEGHIIHALYRSESKANMLYHKNIRLFKGDVTNEESVQRALRSCNYVYHLAAYAKVWAKDPSTFYKTNYLGTMNVLNAAQKSGVKKTVYISTAGVFGPSFHKTVHEKTKSSIELCTEYERTKAKAERLVMEFISQGQHIVIVNPTRIYGPGLLNESNSVTRMINLYINGRFRVLPGDGNSVGNYVFIDDIVRGLILAMEKGKCGEKYILGGVNVSYRDFFDTLSGVTGIKYIQFTLPVSFMLAISNVMLFLSKTAGISPLITPQWVKKYNYNWELTSQKSRDQLGYRITPLEDGLRKTVNYLKEIKFGSP